jgi:hypothetical protein
MPAVTVRTQETFQAVHTADADWKETIVGWALAEGVPQEEADNLVADMAADLESQVTALGVKGQPWIVRTPQGLLPMAPDAFLSTFDDVNATDVLDDIWRERQTHPGRGYDAKHDDAETLTHLTHQVEVRMQSIMSSAYPTDAERRHELVVAGSLIVAAIDKIDRAQTVRTFTVD